ncbi:FAD-dependent oxidoreductase [Acaryochloris sp. CCMEE 5410]|uniref:FAD-dependent oxidoreductase n=1 Tax=Acaryochloris sp. CCMEE 5410 TaxID=310037 RepID=UPI00024843E3|nr:FAD-dependent oxidoreductase [Acaryochloris sp. CCMEE 5410]KAI9129928.1 FAD-dependent oxidoreductase [Acaryochloris sp. CCMEE 5410]
MRIAVIGGGAAGMATAYLLDKLDHHITVFERQPILGGHIRTLNKNVKPSQFECNEILCNEILESGPLEFPDAFHNFVALMQELEVELVPVNVGSELFLKDSSNFLSDVAIEKNFKGIQRLIEYLRFNSLHVRSAGLWLKTRFTDMDDFYDQSLSRYLKDDSTSNLWLKLLTMYSYSIPFKLINDFPAELAIPMLRDYLAVNWLRVEGGVYTYIEKILKRFKGEVLLDVQIANISRNPDIISIEQSQGEIQEFDKVVFATPPDQVMSLLSDPTDAELRRFSAWQANFVTTTVHTDTSMYDKYGIRQPSEFDFFQTDTRWGYNGCLNQLCGLPASAEHYFLSFQLEEIIAKDKIVHIQKHHTPLYTTESFRYRDEIAATNGENSTYYVGAYLGDGLHEGAITSAMKVADMIG